LIFLAHLLGQWDFFCFVFSDLLLL